MCIRVHLATRGTRHSLLPGVSLTGNIQHCVHTDLQPGTLHRAALQGIWRHITMFITDLHPGNKILFGPCAISIHLRLPNHLLDSKLAANIRKFHAGVWMNLLHWYRLCELLALPQLQQYINHFKFFFHLRIHVALNKWSWSQNACWYDDTILSFRCGFRVTLNTCVWKTDFSALHGHILLLRVVRSWCWHESLARLNEWGWIQSADLDWDTSDTGCVKQNKAK